MKIVNIHEAKTTLSALIRRVLEGEKVVIAKNNQPVAELRPIQHAPKPRKPGLLKGKMKLLQTWEKADEELADLMLKSKIQPGNEADD